MSPDTTLAQMMPSTNFKDLSGGDFVLLLKDLGKSLEGHPAYQGEVPAWIPNAQRLYRHGVSRSDFGVQPRLVKGGGKGRCT